MNSPAEKAQYPRPALRVPCPRCDAPVGISCETMTGDGSSCGVRILAAAREVGQDRMGGTLASRKARAYVDPPRIDAASRRTLATLRLRTAPLLKRWRLTVQAVLGPGVELHVRRAAATYREPTGTCDLQAMRDAVKVADGELQTTLAYACMSLAVRQDRRVRGTYTRKRGKR